MRFLTLFGFLALLTGGALIAAQTSPDEPTPTAIDCAPDALTAHQAELAALLEDFEAQLEEDEAAALGRMYEVGLAYRDAALACGYIPDNIGELVIGTRDMERILTVLDTLYGDPVQGQLLYNGEDVSTTGSALGCSGCHSDADIAPLTEGTWTRWDEQRRLLPQYADADFRYYAVESIIHPLDYVVDGYGETMPQLYPDVLGYQDLADLIAYLESQDQLLEE